MTYTYRTEMSGNGRPIVVVEAGPASALAIVENDGSYQYQADDCDQNPIDDAGWPDIPADVIREALSYVDGHQDCEYCDKPWEVIYDATRLCYEHSTQMANGGKS